VPGSGAWLLSFGTPVVGLAGPMITLFAAIAETLGWIE